MAPNASKSPVLTDSRLDPYTQTQTGEVGPLEGLWVWIYPLCVWPGAVLIPARSKQKATLHIIRYRKTGDHL